MRLSRGGHFMKLPIVEDSEFDDFDEELDYEPRLSLRDCLYSAMEKLKSLKKEKKINREEEFDCQPRLSLRERWQIRKEQRKDYQNSKTKKGTNLNLDSISQVTDIILTGSIMLLSVILTFLVVISPIALLPKTLLFALGVAMVTVSENGFTKAFHEYKNQKSCNKVERDTLDITETQEPKISFFQKLKNKFSKTHSKSDVSSNDSLEENTNTLETFDDPVDENSQLLPIEEEKEKEKEKMVPKVKNSFFSKISLTRSYKPVTIKSWNVKREKGLGIYYISVPKEDKYAQIFIRQEVKSQYPEEKIQTFETEQAKVFVLSKKPTFMK